MILRLLLVAALAGPLATPGFAQCPDGTPPPCRSGAASRTRPGPTSVAVLDFENLSRDTGDVYLSDGLADELTSRLGQVSRLTVTSRTAVRRLRNVADMAVPDIGRTLNVSYLLHGSIRRSGARLRVTAELLRAATGAIEWSNQFDESQQDLLAIQEAVATSVASAVVGRLLPAERSTLAVRPTRNPQAYDLFLRAQEHYRRVANTTEMRLTISQLEQVLALDSAFAHAWAEMSIMHSLLFWTYDDRSPARLALSRQTAERALALAPNEAWSHTAMGYYYYWGSRDYGHALQEFSAALALNPNDPEVHAAIANVTRRQGNEEQSLISRNRALALDPTNASETDERGLTYMLIHNYEEAERDIRRSLVVDPQFSLAFLDLAHVSILRTGAIPAAVAESLAAHVAGYPGVGPDQQFPVWRFAGAHLAAVVGLAPPAGRVQRAGYYLFASQALSALGRRQEAAVAAESVRTIVTELQPRMVDDFGFHDALGYAYLTLGRCDDALREARRAAEILPVSRDAAGGMIRVQELAEMEAGCGLADSALTHAALLLNNPSYVSKPLLRADPLWAPLRADPRFQRLVAEP